MAGRPLLTRVRTGSGAGRIVLVQNEADSGPGRLPDWLAAAGAMPTVVRAYRGERLPGADEADGFVVLGGGFMPDEDDRAPWLRDERALIEACLAQRTPVLGICLGAQLTAHALGGIVRASYGAPERGVTELTVRPEATDDDLFGGLPRRVVAVENHQDRITRLPRGATWLISSAACRYQAFRIGTLWCTQFHPEKPGTDIAGWDPERTRALGGDPEQIAADGRDHADELERTWSAVAARFAALTGALV